LPNGRETLVQVLAKQKAVVVCGYAAALTVMVLAGWPLAEILPGDVVAGSLATVRTVQAFMFGLSFFAVPPMVRAAGYRRSMLLAGAIFVVGLVFLVLGDSAGLFAMVIAAEACVAFGRAGMVALWTARIVQGASKSSGFGIAAGWLLSSVTLVAAVNMGTVFWLYFFVVLLLAGTNLALFYQIPDVDAPTSRVNSAWCSVKGSVRAVLLPLVLVSLLGFVSFMLKTIAFPQGTIAGMPAGMFQSICNIAVAALILVLLAVRGEALVTGKVLNALYFATTTCCLVFPALNSTLLPLITALSIVICTASSILIIMVCGERAAYSQSKMLPLYCLFAGVYHVLSALGNAFGFWAAAAVGDGLIPPYVMPLACIWVLSIALVAVASRRSKMSDALVDVGPVGQPAASPSMQKAAVQDWLQTYGLTNRENEVFELLVQGRDANYICAKLFVSETTVRTHIRNIYRKLGIHNRQELFNLVHGDD